MVVSKKTIIYNLSIFNLSSLLILIILMIVWSQKLIGIQVIYASLITIVFCNINLVIGLFLPNKITKMSSKLTLNQLKSVRFGFFMLGILTVGSRIIWFVIPIIMIGIINNWEIQGEIFNVLPALIWPLLLLATHIFVNYWLINKELKEQNRLKELNKNVATGDSLQEPF
ncbi:MG406 family protein [Mycoplasma sp. E35C]|uniref:MG406 family protein n=1 Tax=Mycoplasma sp. E35C TaxID=2801918 RepID=UPI001CA3AA30|nr:MG406 family protein [Mycoplasma sp. E35C]QZX49385.1 MG406 family protein [Mycoplasma sp. E35C]